MSDELSAKSDAQLNKALQRVAFSSGILLGAKALGDEQVYHLQRLTRHQRWLVGPGTVFGLQVTVEAPSGDVLLKVGPGYAIDGLGREVLVDEPYGISLRDWMNPARVDVPNLNDNFQGGTLFLRVTVRARTAPVGLQPTVSQLFDAGIDPVVPARVVDAFLLELLGDDARLGDGLARPLAAWSPQHDIPGPADLPGGITAREQATITAVTDPAEASALRLQSWLLRQGLPAFDDSPGADQQYIEASRLLLASVHVSLAQLSDTPTLAGTAVNNLVRPFVRPSALLAAAPLP